VVERLITYGKRGNLHAIRLAARTLKSESIVKKLFDDIAPAYKDRAGGYTRILKLAPRNGDNADMAIIELVGRRGEEPRRKPGKKRASGRKKQASQQRAQAEPRAKTKRSSKKAAAKEDAKTPSQTVESDAEPAQAGDAPAEMHAQESEPAAPEAAGGADTPAGDAEQKD
ncbi:MAG: 50S ribosomal protein L17, partial [Chitinivibrionales bacterium]|nr:50S ribosomal protein L17 [Chitinivibrionales bacterium]MBD3396152.1 50S ribosomal protein L17 [Chitinivibrionales bacterium]